MHPAETPAAHRAAQLPVPTVSMSAYAPVRIEPARTGAVTIPVISGLAQSVATGGFSFGCGKHEACRKDSESSNKHNSEFLHLPSPANDFRQIVVSLPGMSRACRFRSSRPVTRGRGLTAGVIDEPRRAPCRSRGNEDGTSGRPCDSFGHWISALVRGAEMGTAWRWWRLLSVSMSRSSETTSGDGWP
jgi:hypothetical protein